ncbi:YchJ family protein [Erwinia psidii]|uniref:YchJ family protein n=1 Tax=Erwinia psidii TaxID=69224 RepID=UPI00226B7F75|nr:YchJ family protein [Erwinia psidii]MCX8955908.1 YchJ family protein [Erwinia psidii]
MSEPCPCCSGLQYNLCCQPCLSGKTLPSTPEVLMRSRYTAYAKKDTDYLMATWHPACQPVRFRTSIEQSASETEWLSLHVISAQVGRDNAEGYVTFFARYSENQRERFIHERSRFLKVDQRWYYMDGTYPVTGRNDRCPCDSGKKFKKCCGQ